MAKRKIDENYMKTLLVEGLPYKPPVESSVSEEQRMKALDEIEGRSAVPAPPDPPQEIEAMDNAAVIDVAKPTAESKPPVKKTQRADESVNSLDEYRAEFFKSREIKIRTSFVADKEILQVLRYILLDTDSEVSLSDYVGNILTHHILQFRELINSATSKNLRKQTIPKL
ncbi:MAG TPA: DUF3408 domain-containing protein [Petrimonas sp.]|nr:DUF3408 domain-containing protein [Petrimonas sp.]